jgi:peptidoglycan/xylan/chitin deacetylase (PgdA/CDA1 family)
MLSRTLAALLVWLAAVPPYRVAFAADTEALSGTYSFISADPFTAGQTLTHLNLTLNPDGTAHVEQVSAAVDAPFTADGTWMKRGDEVQLLMDHAADRYWIRLVDGFPAALEYSQGGEVEPFGPLVFSLGSGDVHPLVSRLNTMLAHVDHVDFRDPGPDVQRFGEYTRRAVAQFQSTHGLPPTGMVALPTWRALVAAAGSGAQDPVGEATYTAAGVRSAADGTQPIYLTFDDGPDPTWTPRVMDVLKRYGASGTFFMVGQEVEAHPEVVRGVVQAGDYAADHTWEHESLQGASQAEFVQSVESTRDVIVSTASDLFSLDGTVAYVRPPYGETDESTRSYAADLGMSVVMWDVDPMDWREPGAQQIADYVLDNAYPGAIVLMHDGGGDRSQTVAALETILPGLAAQGYRFPTIYAGDPSVYVAPPAPSTPAAPVATPVPANPNAWHVAGTGGSGANVREKPSTSAAVVAVLPDGTAVQPLGGPVQSDGMAWLEIRSGSSVQGWIAADLLQPPNRGSTSLRPLITLPASPQWMVAGTDGAGANLRALPSTDADVVAVLEEGTPVHLLEGPISADGLWWRKVSADGQEGWIVASYVRLRLE